MSSVFPKYYIGPSGNILRIDKTEFDPRSRTSVASGINRIGDRSYCATITVDTISHLYTELPATDPRAKIIGKTKRHELTDTNFENQES